MSQSSERIVVIRNPASSCAREVQRGVVDRLYDSGIAKSQLMEFWTPSANSSETTEALSEVIQPGDQIIVAAGDGTGNAVANAYIQADCKGVQLGFLPYGNFNDMAATFTGSGAQKDPSQLLDNAQIVDVHPLEIVRNGEHYRYALLYATLGWTAHAAAIFDAPQTRKALQNGKANLANSLFTIAKMYFKTRSSSALPPFQREGDPNIQRDTTDVLAINGPIMAKIIRSLRSYYETDEFLSLDLDVSNLLANTQLLGRSALNIVTPAKLHLPGSTTSQDTLRFLVSSSLPIQLDGEVSQLRDVKTLSIVKDQSTNAKLIKVMKTTK